MKAASLGLPGLELSDVLLPLLSDMLEVSFHQQSVLPGQRPGPLP